MDVVQYVTINCLETKTIILTKKWGFFLNCIPVFLRHPVLKGNVFWVKKYGTITFPDDSTIQTSLVEPSPCVSKHFSTVSNLGHIIRSKTQHTWYAMTGGMHSAQKCHISLENFHVHTFLVINEITWNPPWTHFRHN